VEGCERILGYPSDIDAFASLFADLPGFALLSGIHDSRTLHIISALPRKVLRNHAGHWSLQNGLDSANSTHGVRYLHPSQVMDYLTGWLSEYEAPSGLPFNGGLIGFLGYEAKYPLAGVGAPRRETPSMAERQPKQKENLTTPCLQVGLYDWAILCDDQAQSCRLFFHPQCDDARRELILERLSQQVGSPLPFKLRQKFRPDQSRQAYGQNFARIQEYILAGDCYQINYAQRFSATFEGDPWTAFRLIRQCVQAPYSAFIRTEQGAVLSFSPEQFISIQDQAISTAPIKGTRPRGATPEEDSALLDELAQSPKDRAENLMIVDLLRNDLSLHAQTGSVKVTKLFEIQSFHNVHHLVTTIEALKKPEVSPLTVLWDAFPGGSITGAPKKRAMEIIEELEPHRRSAYCGSIFWCSHSGQLNSNIAIRTLVCEGDQIYCWGGGGIVTDSVEEKEYQESISKVSYFMKALEQEFWAPNT